MLTASDMIALVAAISSVWPSGAAEITWRVPISPPPPERFSTMTVWPHIVASCWLMARARMSVPPPGAAGTTMRISVPGKDCAKAGAAAVAAREESRKFRREIMNRPLTLDVMPALVAGIHVFFRDNIKQDVDGRDKPGHDDRESIPQ